MPITLVLSIITTSSIFAGVILGLLQIRQTSRQRAKESALQMLHSFRTPEFLSAVNIVFELPEGLSKKQIEDLLGDKITNILVMFGTFESLGILVFKGDVSVEMVEDFFSGIIVLSGRKLKNYVEEIRATGNRQTYYEWFQWLYEQIEKRESKSPAIPAYIAFRDVKI